MTLAPTGTVSSYTVVHYAANRALADAVPYTVVLVSLDEAPHIRVVGNLDGDDVHIGMPVVPTGRSAPPTTARRSCSRSGELLVDPIRRSPGIGRLRPILESSTQT